jgi:hypothetical protein
MICRENGNLLTAQLRGVRERRHRDRWVTAALSVALAASGLAVIALATWQSPPGWFPL